MNTETVQQIRSDARQDFEDLASLLIVTKTLCDEQSHKWKGVDDRIDHVIDSIKDLLKGNYLDIFYFSLVKKNSLLAWFY